MHSYWSRISLGVSEYIKKVFYYKDLIVLISATPEYPNEKHQAKALLKLEKNNCILVWQIFTLDILHSHRK